MTIVKGGRINTLIEERDIIARATNNIINTVGLENLKLFMRMDEKEGSTAYDFINRDLKFLIENFALQYGKPSPFGKSIRFSGSGDRLMQLPVSENNIGSTDFPMLNNSKVATRVRNISTMIGFIRARLKRVGSLPSATIRLVIYSDDNGVPGTIVSNGISDTLDCQSIGTSYELRGFSFQVAPKLQKNLHYWVVLEYVNNSNVNSSNYISWAHDSGNNSYGQRRAHLNDGNWVFTEGENHVFGIWNNQLVLEEDFSIIALVKNRFLDGNAYKTIVSMMGMKNPSMQLGVSNEGSWYTYAHDNLLRRTDWYEYPSEFHVVAQTFSKERSKDKSIFWVDGRIKSSVNGVENTRTVPMAQPLRIGADARANGVNGALWQGEIGAVIITSSELTATQIAEVTRNLYSLRNYGQEV